MPFIFTDYFGFLSGLLFLMIGLLVALAILYRTKNKLSNEHTENQNLVNSQHTVLNAIPDLMFKLNEEGQYLGVGPMMDKKNIVHHYVATGKDITSRVALEKNYTNKQQQII